MKIIIMYDSCWRNSFLDGSNNEALPKKGRKFIGSMTNLKKIDNFKQRTITHNTVMGLLNRLIGDQRKLYQARNSTQNDHYYFKELEPLITFKVNDDPKKLTQEMTFIRNITGSTDQNSFTGMIKMDDVIFSSDYSAPLWGILALDFMQLCEFIVLKKKVNVLFQANPLAISEQFATLKKEKPVENNGLVTEAIHTLDTHFPDTNYLNNKGKVVPSTLYCSALYLQLKRLSTQFDISSAVTKSGVISGISKRIFTKKDFMNRFTTGEKKKIWGNPYIRKERIKGQGEVVSMMTKAGGQLDITIAVDRKKGKEIKQMIENAGVSSFYLGKKGLAYVAKIRL